MEQKANQEKEANMLPKLDSTEWSTQWGVGQKLDALNEAIQCLQESLDGKLGEILEKEIRLIRLIKPIFNYQYNG